MSDPVPPPASSSSATSTTTFLSSAYLGSIPRDSINDLQSFLDGQAAMEQEAKEAMPFETGECSYDKGYVRQSVWACRECKGKGICYGCSISCHAEHDLVELFQRRKFRCDCPTEGPASTSSSASSSGIPSVSASAPKSTKTESTTRCTLQPAQPTAPFPPNTSNVYTRNFLGKFCRCPKGEAYDPMEEEESMVVCLGCEDWFHEGCLNLYDPSKSPPLDPEDEPEQSATAPLTMTTTASNPSLLRPDSYAHVICRECIAKHPITRRLAGTLGWMTILPRQIDDKQGQGSVDAREWKDHWELVGVLPENQAAEQVEVGPEVEVGMKRKVEQEEGSTERDAKRSKLDPSSPSEEGNMTKCLLPPIVERAQRAYGPSATDGTYGKGDVFLAEGQREKLAVYLTCGCNECKAEHGADRAAPFPLSEEEEGELYEPPREAEEEGPAESIDDMTAKALNGLPRSQAIETMIKFNEMKDKLKVFLEGFRGGDKVVKEEDIRLFVDGMKEQADKR